MLFKTSPRKGEKILVSGFFEGDDIRRLLRMTTPSSMAASRFKYNT